MKDIRIKRVYEPTEPGDGFRVLVDRLWPRGLSKQEARVDLWAKDIAPSTELRHWFHAHLDQRTEFEARYRQELANAGPALKAIVDAAGHRPITLLYAIKAIEHSHASVVRDLLLHV